MTLCFRRHGVFVFLIGLDDAAVLIFRSVHTTNPMLPLEMT
jgi:hypothetical protein